MVMVSSYGLMSADEQERSKRPFSTVISAVEPGGLMSPPPPSAYGAAQSPEQAQQQTAQQPEPHHGRGAGGPTGPGGHVGAPKPHTLRWKLERREVDSKAAARRVGESLREAEGEGEGAEEPRTSLLDDSEEESPESAAPTTAAQQGRDRRAVKVGATARDEQKRVREANHAVQLAATERNNQRRGVARNTAAAPAPTAVATTSDGFAVPQPLGYHERRGIPVIPPSRQRPNAAATPLLPPGMEFEPRARSAGPTVGALAQTPSASSNSASTSASAATTAAPASCSRIPQHSRLLQAQPTSKQ